MSFWLVSQINASTTIVIGHAVIQELYSKYRSIVVTPITYTLWSQIFLHFVHCKLQCIMSFKVYYSVKEIVMLGMKQGGSNE
jgi:uncharacterized UBP type Zn finger protein